MDVDTEKSTIAHVRSHINIYKATARSHNVGFLSLSAALRAAEKAYTEAKTEKQSLGTGDFSIAPVRTEELESIMEATLARRTRMIAGLESACQALNGHGE